MNRDCSVFYLNYQDGPSEDGAEKVRQYLLVAVAYDVGHVWDAVRDPLQAIRLTETASNDEPRQRDLFHLLSRQRGDSFMQVQRFEWNLEHGAHRVLPLGLRRPGALLHHKGVQTALLALGCPYLELHFLDVS